jgi:hypothetical protein
MVTDDIVAIEQLLYRYCFAVDKGTADDVAALFHESATLMPIYSGDPPGPKAAPRSANGTRTTTGNGTPPWTICGTA